MMKPSRGNDYLTIQGNFMPKFIHHAEDEFSLRLWTNRSDFGACVREWGFRGLKYAAGADENSSLLRANLRTRFTYFNFITT